MAEGTTQRKSPKDMWQQESDCDVRERIIYSHPRESFEDPEQILFKQLSFGKALVFNIVFQ